jgi:hypothetical protein
MEQETIYDKHGVTCRVSLDEPTENPLTDWDTDGFIGIWHRGGNTGNCADRFPRPADILVFADENKDDIFDVVPIYCYEHGNVVYSTAPFSCPFDSGQVGIAVFTNEQAQSWRRTAGDAVDDIRGRIRGYLDGLLRDFTAWANGEVYYYEVEIDGEHYESCGGFIGSDFDGNGLREHSRADIKWALKKVRERRRSERSAAA